MLDMLGDAARFTHVAFGALGLTAFLDTGICTKRRERARKSRQSVRLERVRGACSGGAGARFSYRRAACRGRAAGRSAGAL